MDSTLIDQARSDRSTNLSNKAKLFITANPDLTSDAAREAFIGQHGDSAGAEFDVIAGTLKTNQRAVPS